MLYDCHRIVQSAEYDPHVLFTLYVNGNGNGARGDAGTKTDAMETDTELFLNRSRTSLNSGNLVNSGNRINQ